MKYYTINYPSDQETKDWLLNNYWTAIFWCEFIQFSVYFNVWCSQLGG